MLPWLNCLQDLPLLDEDTGVCLFIQWTPRVLRWNLGLQPKVSRFISISILPLHRTKILVKSLQPTTLARILSPLHQLIHRCLWQFQRRDDTHFGLMGSLLFFNISLYILLLLASMSLYLEMVVRSHLITKVCRKIGGITHHMWIWLGNPLLGVHFLYHLLDEFIKDPCFVF